MGFIYALSHSTIPNGSLVHLYQQVNREGTQKTLNEYLPTYIFTKVIKAKNKRGCEYDNNKETCYPFSSHGKSQPEEKTYSGNE